VNEGGRYFATMVLPNVILTRNILLLVAVTPIVQSLPSTEPPPLSSVYLKALVQSDDRIYNILQTNQKTLEENLELKLHVQR